jgi:DNA-binding response OmpR family regulator
MEADCVLLLEDEPFIAMDVEEILTAAGAKRVVVIDTVMHAEKWLGANTPDIAINDPRLRDGVCTSVVRRLAARAIPYIVYSGDPAATTDEAPEFATGMWLSKPCLPEEMISAVTQSLVRA